MFRKHDDYTEKMAEVLNRKLAEFYERVRGKKIVIGFTGGLKSFILAELARPVVAGMKCIFVETSFTSPQDLFHTQKFMNSEENLEMETEIIQQLDLSQNILILNSDERDFFCKKGIADLLERKRIDIKYDLILDGTDSVYFQEFWSGKKQFGENYFMVGELGISRDDLVYLSKKHGFKYMRHPEINMLSRFAYNMPVTDEILKTVMELEEFVQSLTNIRLLRVRVLDMEHVTIEVRQKDLSKLLDEKNRKKIFSKFNEKGFASINVDLAGYRRNNLFRPPKS